MVSASPGCRKLRRAYSERDPVLRSVQGDVAIGQKTDSKVPSWAKQYRRSEHLDGSQIFFCEPLEAVAEHCAIYRRNRRAVSVLAPVSRWPAPRPFEIHRSFEELCRARVALIWALLSQARLPGRRR